MAAVLTLYLLTTVGVHSFVSAQITELRVGFQTHLTLEWLHTTVDVLVLFQAARRRERLATVGTGVRPRPQVVGPDVTLEVGGVDKNLAAILTRKTGERIELKNDNILINSNSD